MRPPAAFRLESAMAVTFTLDLRALLAAPAAMALTESAGTASDGSPYEPIELLHPLRSHANKITVFSQVGEIALPHSRRVFAFLERIVVPVDAPLGGIVHPKVWVLRYEAVGEPTYSQQPEQRLRVLVASRNLTFDASWDTVVRLDEATDAAGAMLGPVGELFEGLLDAAVGTVSTHHQDRVLSLSAALGSTRFALPAGVDDLRTHVLGLSRKPSPLPGAVERSLIISPFVSDDFFTRMRPVSVDELVSRLESLDLLRSGTLDNVASVYAFDDGSTPDVDAEYEGSSRDDPGRALVGLHAKIFAFEEGDRARLFLGSANATGAAFNSNVEVLVELAGPVSVLGIDRLCDGIGFHERRMRTRFGVAFGNQTLDDGGEARVESVSRAFNSPFWPFVLISTSIGQEGLDFHLWCHAVVHWNLPSNPVDLEQREGRVHRYKGHAVRRNIATTLGPELSANAISDGVDPWGELFAMAVAKTPEADDEMVPYWVFHQGPAKIERHVPVMPFSRDAAALPRLRKTLAAYRLAFGQPRQEELVEFLGADRSDEDLLILASRLRIDLSPP